MQKTSDPNKPETPQPSTVVPLNRPDDEIEDLPGPADWELTHGYPIDDEE